MSFEYRSVKITLKMGSIVDEDVDAIVNPANSLMIMGGGVAGVIKMYGGEEIEREALRYAPVPVGRAIATSAGRLRARYVIHAPTMEKPAERTSLEAVRRATSAALETAYRLRVGRIAFPGMGTGVGGLPVYDAVRVMAEVVKEALDSGYRFSEIVFVAYTQSDIVEFSRALNDVFGIGV
ncbi:MAG: macro domain-containing protein [Candidatus Bathyarchaeia archaeon]